MDRFPSVEGKSPTSRVLIDESVSVLGQWCHWDEFGRLCYQRCQDNLWMIVRGTDRYQLFDSLKPLLWLFVLLCTGLYDPHIVDRLLMVQSLKL